MTPTITKLIFLLSVPEKEQIIEIHPNLWTINESHLFESQVGLHAMQGYPLHKMHFSQYQASSAVLVWPESRSIGTALLRKKGSHIGMQLALFGHAGSF